MLCFVSYSSFSSCKLLLLVGLWRISIFCFPVTIRIAPAVLYVFQIRRALAEKHLPLCTNAAAVITCHLLLVSCSFFIHTVIRNSSVLLTFTVVFHFTVHLFLPSSPNKVDKKVINVMMEIRQKQRK